MYNFKRSVLRFRSATLKKTLWVMGLAGFGFLMSCNKYGEPIAEYGVPYSVNTVDFHGSVLSADSLKPIPNIKVKLYSDVDDTVYTATNAQGIYSAHKYTFENQKVKMIFYDVDSTLNGSFLSKNIEVDVSFRDINNMDHLADVSLQRKP